jgi:hypothetical protein
VRSSLPRQALGHHDSGSSRRREHEAASARRFTSLWDGGAKACAFIKTLKYRGHLKPGEARTQTPPGSPAERQPRMRLWRMEKEALGPKRVWIGVQVGAPVNQVCTRSDEGMRRKRVPADCVGDRQFTLNAGQRRTEPERLAHDRIEVAGRVITSADFAQQPIRHRRLVDEVLDGPGKRRRCGLVPSEQQRTYLVAEHLLGSWLADAVSRREQVRQQIGALGAMRIPPPQDYLLEYRVIEPAAPLGEGAVGRQGSQSSGERQRHKCSIVRDDGKQLLDPSSDFLAQRMIGRPEDGPEDHVERDRLEPWPYRKRPTQRPAIDLAIGGRPDRTAASRQVIAVECGEHRPALAKVIIAVGQQDRALAEYWRHRFACCSCAGEQRISEERSDGVWVGDEYVWSAAP